MRDIHPLQRAGRGLIVFAGAAAIVACRSAPLATAEPSPTGFTLQSPGCADNAMLTGPCVGKNPNEPNSVGDKLSPALTWERAPSGTRSIAILMDDQAGHVYTMIATTLEPGALPAGLSKAQLLEALAGKTRGAASLALRFAH